MKNDQFLKTIEETAQNQYPIPIMMKSDDMGYPSILAWLSYINGKLVIHTEHRITDNEYRKHTGDLLKTEPGNWGSRIRLEGNTIKIWEKSSFVDQPDEEFKYRIILLEPIKPQ